MKHFSLRAVSPWLVAGALLVQTPTSQADPAPASGVLSVRLVKVRNDHGQVGCALWSSSQGFPKDRRAALQARWCSIAKGMAVCRFDPLFPGTYAVACFHDENDNRVLDTGIFGIPKEGVVASNHAKGFMGPPSFEDAKFAFSGSDAQLRLEMAY